MMATVKHKAVVVNISRLYREDMRGQELYEATRGFWVVNKNREKAEYAIAVVGGIAKEVYRIHKWHPAGTLKYKKRGDISEWKGDDRRWEFEGEVAEENVRRLYLWREIYVDGKTVKGLRSRRYANIKGAQQ